MRPILLLITSTFVLSVSGQINTVDLKDEPIVTDLFNAQELEQLQKLVDIYDDIIKADHSDLNLYDAYKKYFTVRSNNGMELYDQVYAKALSDIDPSEHLNVKAWMDELNDSGLFHEIWITNEHFSIEKKRGGLVKKCAGIDLLFLNSGRYFQFMELKSKTDILFEEYVSSLRKMKGDVGPSAIKLMLDMVTDDTLDPNVESNRLVIALHYLTLGTQLNCNGKYR